MITQTEKVNERKPLTKEERDAILAIVDKGRDAVITAIKAALKKRSGHAWSVTGGKGTSWGWIDIAALPSLRTWTHVPRPGMGECPPPGDEHWVEVDSGRPSGHMGPIQRAELASLLGMDSVHSQGESIPAGSDYQRQYLCRALYGHAGNFTAAPSWD